MIKVMYETGWAPVKINVYAGSFHDATKNEEES